MRESQREGGRGGKAVGKTMWEAAMEGEREKGRGGKGGNSKGRNKCKQAKCLGN